MWPVPREPASVCSVPPTPSRLVDNARGILCPLELDGVQEQEWAGGSCPEKNIAWGKAFSTCPPPACQQGPMEGPELSKGEWRGSSPLPAPPDPGLSLGVFWCLELSTQVCFSPVQAVCSELECPKGGWVSRCRASGMWL